jgi:hypothetical protein
VLSETALEEVVVSRPALDEAQARAANGAGTDWRELWDGVAEEPEQQADSAQQAGS